MSNPDRHYFERRRAESLARADDASDPAIAKLHRQLASHYDVRLEESDAIAQQGINTPNA